MHYCTSEGLYYHCLVTSVPSWGATIYRKVLIRVVSGNEFKTYFVSGPVILYRLHLDLKKKNEEPMWKPRVRVCPIFVGVVLVRLSFFGTAYDLFIPFIWLVASKKNLTFLRNLSIGYSLCPLNGVGKETTIFRQTVLGTFRERFGPGGLPIFRYKNLQK
jgi:hypothetical protein